MIVDTIALMSLAPHLPPAHQTNALSQALAAATAISSDYYRAQVLASLAPHLPAGQQTNVLGQALAAAAAISDDGTRGQALASLTRHLPPELLDQALTAEPNGSARAIIALLDRSTDVLPSAEFATGLALLRTSLSEVSRDVCLRIISVTAPKIAGIGGSESVQAIVTAIEASHTWWP